MRTESLQNSQRPDEGRKQVLAKPGLHSPKILKEGCARPRLDAQRPNRRKAVLTTSGRGIRAPLSAPTLPLQTASHRRASVGFPSRSLSRSLGSSSARSPAAYLLLVLLCTLLGILQATCGHAPDSSSLPAGAGLPGGPLTPRGDCKSNALFSPAVLWLRLL